MAEPNPKLAEALSDRYSIEREVGAGGMATVFLAHDKKHERRVALKVLRPELAAAMGGDRFPREIRMVAQFNHPHILSLYDSGESAGFLYYVMPFVEGESLRERLTRDKQLPVSDALRILRDVADALAYSHARGVVHRDIKPANVMLSGRHAVVTDFGVAKALSASGGDKVTTVGIAVGTPQYMAPEQAMGEANIDHRADLYALGLLGYEMLAGHPTFDSASAQAVLAAQVMEKPADIQQVRPGIPPLLGDAIMRCLAKNPADRWQSAEELLARLEAIGSTPSGGITPTNTRPLPATAARPAKSKRPVLMGAAAAVVIVLALGTWNLLGGGGPAGIRTIAVMPLEDISGKDSVFVNSMHAELTSALSKLNIGVIQRSVMMRYKGGNKTNREIARENGIDAMIDATVFRADSVMRITVQFSDPVTSKALWSDSYDRNVSNVLKAQTEVAQLIVAGIGKTLSPAGKSGENK